MININSFIADELVNKNKYLAKALDQANHIILLLEEENTRLKSVLQSLSDSSSLQDSLLKEDTHYTVV